MIGGDSMNKMIKKIMILTLGTLILTFGFFFFIMPFNLTIGGISGIAISLNAFVPQIPTGIFVMIMDTILYIVHLFLQVQRRYLKFCYQILNL